VRLNESEHTSRSKVVSPPPPQTGTTTTTSGKKRLKPTAVMYEEMKREPRKIQEGDKKERRGGEGAESSHR